MVTKKSAGVGVVTEADAHAVLRRAPARELAPEEEKVMRMRLGASPPRAAPLERSFDGPSDLWRRLVDQPVLLDHVAHQGTPHTWIVTTHL